MLVLLVRHFLKLFLYSDKADRDILGRYSYYGSNFIVAHVFEPEKYYCPVKKPQLAYTALQQLYLPDIFACVIEKVDVHLKRHCLSSALFLALRRDASVQTDTVYPCVVTTLPAKLLKTIPQVDEDVLEKVGNLLLIFREHITDSIDGSFMLPYNLRKILFQ